MHCKSRTFSPGGKEDFFAAIASMAQVTSV